jgi:integrase
MATIQTTTRPDGSKRYRVFIRRKGHRTLTRVFTKKRDAEGFAREHDTEARLQEQDRLALGRKRPVADLLERYMAEYDGRDDARVRLLAWWREHLGERRIAEVTPEVVADLLDQLRQGNALMPRRNGAVASDRPRTDATVNRYHSALSAVFQAALRGRWGWAVENPCRAVGRGKESAGRVRFLSEDEPGLDGKVVPGERTRLLEACRASDWPLLHTLVALALSTGARRGELLGLRWGDVDLARSVAYLGLTKNNDRRALPLIPPVREALLETRKRAAQDAQDGEVVRDIRQDLVFRSNRDPAKPYDIDKPWRAALDAAGVESFRFHDLRHSAASYLAMNGATLIEIADVLGHRTLQMVRRYSHLSHDHKAKLLNRVMPKLVG